MLPKQSEASGLPSLPTKHAWRQSLMLLIGVYCMQLSPATVTYSVAYFLGLVSKEQHNERATSRKSDKSKTVSKERQEYCQFELKIVFIMTKLTLILTLILTTLTTPNPTLTYPQDDVVLLI